ncbi:uncharacterized protein METZ01_LOCUS229595 [marine metagenome]|uniref:Uncharacterized protein n=1 Tax=marine metagenome TaxID=408172 RepID=A0A382GRE4_9ZZZZ
MTISYMKTKYTRREDRIISLNLILGAILLLDLYDNGAEN